MGRAFLAIYSECIILMSRLFLPVTRSYRELGNGENGAVASFSWRADVGYFRPTNQNGVLTMTKYKRRNTHGHVTTLSRQS